jgi:hypothetical protein
MGAAALGMALAARRAQRTLQAPNGGSDGGSGSGGSGGSGSGSGSGSGDIPFAGLSETARETWIENALKTGGRPGFLDVFVPVTTTGGGHTLTFYVTPDYLGVTTSSGWIRTPLKPKTAQRVADALGAMLPTRKMVDLIYEAAPAKIGFTGLTPTSGGPSRSSTEFYARHHAAIEAARAGRGGLAAGHKKDIVVGDVVAHNPGKVVIYGAWDRSGTRVQPLSGVHSDGYVDYSHGVRLVKPYVVLDGVQRPIADVLRDPALAGLLSDDGPETTLRYPS